MSNKSKLQVAYRVLAEALARANGLEEGANLGPFERIDLESGQLRTLHRETNARTVDDLEFYIEQGRSFYAEGNINTAILWAWYAGLLTAKLINSEAQPLRDTQGASMRLMELAERHLPVGRVMRRRVQTPRRGEKTTLRQQWNRCFQSVEGFRDWQPAGQRDYLLTHHVEQCGTLKKDTVRSYCEEFSRDVAQKNTG
jgi:hypothetical protein